MAKAPNIEERIARLKKMSRAELLIEWERLYERAAPRRISHSLLVHAVAYKTQEQVYGGFSVSDQKLLDRMAQAFVNDPSTLKLSFQIKSGTRLQRLWQGKIHEVTATLDGFVYEGIKYRSLSEVARTITGTRWNGLVFFGLKQVSRTKTGGGDEQATA